MTGAFEGFTVVELADRRNQFAGKLLADAGARVIQVEPTKGSPGRWIGPFVDDREDPDRCLDYWWNNTGKESVCIDITRRPGQELLRRLLSKADVFIESTKPGTLKPMGLDSESNAREFPALIHAAISDFGQDGPWVDFEMNDPAHLALGGQMASSGYSDPTVTPIGGQGHQAYNMACVLAAHSVTMALFDRLSSNLGQFIDCAIHDCCAVCTERAVSYWLWYNESYLRMTGQHAGPVLRPSNQIQTADGRYVITMSGQFSNRVWRSLIDWMKEHGVEGELADEKYLDEFTRAQEIRHGSAIREGLIRLVNAVPAEEAFRRGQAIGLPWGAVRAPEENYDLPHYQQRNNWIEVEHDEIGKSVLYPRGFFACEELGVQPRRRAPHLGEHTRAVLSGDLGMGESELAALTATGVIR